MPRAKRFHVLVATDGSASARAALTTAVWFPWPAEARGSAVVAKQVRAEYRRSILLAALDRTSEVNASRASRAMSKRWPDGVAHARHRFRAVDTMHVPSAGADHSQYASDRGGGSGADQ